MVAIYGVVGDAGRAELDAMAARLAHRGAFGAHWSPAPGIWFGMQARAHAELAADPERLGDEKEVHKQLFLKNLSSINVNEFADKRIVIKGCGETPIADFVYMEITKILRPVAKSIMYGEPCSTVPVFKKPAAPKGS